MPETDNKTPDSGAGKPAGPSLYSKGSRSSRMRLLDEQPRKKLIDVEIGGVPRRRQSSRHSPFQHILKAHLKQLGIVGGLMFLLLIAAWKVVGILGEQKTSTARAVRSTLPPSTNASGESATSVISRPISNAPPLAPTIEIERFKKAAYLARKAKAYEDAGELEKAIQNYREALEVLPNTPTVWAQIGRVYLMQKDWWHAQVSLEKAVESNPGSAEILNNLGIAYLWQDGKLDRAMTMFQTAIEVDPNYAPTYFNKALGLLARNDSPKAREALEQYLRMKPDDPRGLREIACLKARFNRRPEALADLEKAIAQAPDWPVLYFDCAAISALQGQCDTAIRFLEKAEPLAGPAPTFKVWQEPAFRECRLSELGKLFEKDLADRARDRIKEMEKMPKPTTSEPIISPAK